MLLFVILLTLTLQPALSKKGQTALSKKGQTALSQQRCVNDYLNPDQYEAFLKKHLNDKIPNGVEISDWQTFIDNKKTWNRKTQSFFPKSEYDKVLGVCSTGGKIYPNTVKLNLCISNDPLEFITVHVDTANKKVTEVKQMNQHVILACEKIENICRPVHFKANINNAKPDNNQPDCSG
ncbi:hypothetical protein PO909_028497 [Leuciscus waleckii]